MRSAFVLALAALLGAGVPARALDLFTLWNQPEIPLDLTCGTWVAYRSQSMASGRSDVDLVRISCLAAPDDADHGDRVFEIVPLQENEQGELEPRPGQGVWLLVDGRIASRSGDLADMVKEAWQWDEGQAAPLDPVALRDDPLASRLLSSDFHPDSVEFAESTTRIVAGRQFLCRQLVMTARDSQSVDLPAGRMTQISSHEISAAFNAELPLLGVAYAAERISSESTLATSNPRFRAPAPRIRVEIMELVGFGRDAEMLLGPGD